MPSLSRRRWVVAPALCVVGVALSWSVAVRAHEIGTTRVSVLLQEGRTYDIEVVTDAAALVEKLEASAGRSSSADTRPAHLQSVLTSFDEKFRQRVKIAFGASTVRPAIAYSVAPGIDAASAGVATIRLTGQIPPDARDFSWTYAWTFASYALSVRSAESETPAIQWLEGDQSSAPFAWTSPAPQVNRLGTAWRYLTLGFTHIVPHGLDHILFVLGIFLLTTRWRSIVAQVSTFTIAHSITLALTMYGIVSLPARVVEPMIALSIVYVAIENLIVRELKPWRLALVFSFGLLHGMGFAGVLRELGLPRPQFVTALVSFNVGVEGGQLFVIGAAFLAMAYWQRNRSAYHRFVVQPASVAIALVGLFWTVQRAFGM